MHAKILRPAIAMIELIFAIVIMGIVLMSAPMLISTATQSGYVALQQEGINEAASRVNMIMGYPWDENNTHDDYIFPVLHANGNALLNMYANTARRIGTPKESQRTFILSDSNNSNLNASALGQDGGDLDDMDDFAGDISLTGTAATVDYVDKTVKINTAFTYMSEGTFVPDGNKKIYFNPDFSTNTPTTNIKSITVTLTSTTGVDELEKTIVLRAFSCNVGGYKYKERTF